MNTSLSQEDMHLGRIGPVVDLELPCPVSIMPKHDIACNNGLEISLTLWGDMCNPPVLLVHGMRDHARSWDWTVERLRHKYYVIAMDLRGHGDSGWSVGAGYDTCAMIADIAAVVTRLREKGIQAPLALVAHSLGGFLSLHYAAAFPEEIDRLVIIEGLGASQKMYDDLHKRPPDVRLRERVAHHLTVTGKDRRQYADPEDMVQRMAGVHRNLSIEQARHLALHGIRNAGKGWVWKYDPVHRMGYGNPVPPAEYLDLYSRLPHPILLLYGKESWAANPMHDGRIKAFQKPDFKCYGNAGHWLQHDVFDVFSHDVLAFLNQ